MKTIALTKKSLKIIHQLDQRKYKCLKKLPSRNLKSTLALNKKEITLLNNTKLSLRLKCAETGSFLVNANSKISVLLPMEKVNF